MFVKKYQQNLFSLTQSSLTYINKVTIVTQMFWEEINERFKILK